MSTVQLLSINPVKTSSAAAPDCFALGFKVQTPSGLEEQAFTLSYRTTRFMCPCAHCVDEHSGQRTLKLDQVPQDIRATGVQRIGRYAVSISFSDGHKTGIYSDETLYELSQTEGSTQNLA